MDFVVKTIDDYLGPPDPRVVKYPLMDGPILVTVICTLYVIFVQFIGPKFMQHRQPYQLGHLMLYFDIISVILNCAISYVGLLYFFLYGASFKCENSQFKGSELIARSLPTFSYVYFLSKLLQLSDGLFSVLRKKRPYTRIYQLLTQAEAPIAVWFVVRYAPSGLYVFGGWVNSMVNTVSYAYFALAAIGPEVKKYLWWKPNLIIFQLVHFVIIIIHQSQAFYAGCSFPKLLSGAIITHFLWYFYLFVDYYREITSKVERKEHRLKSA